MQLRTDRARKAKTHIFWKGFVICLHKAVALTLFGVVSGIAWLRIYFLKTWVDRSGWIKPGRVPNPENDWLENGQMLPMLQLVMIGVFISNEFELEIYSPTLNAPSPQSGVQFDDVDSQSQPSVPIDRVAGSGGGTQSRRRPGFRDSPL